MRRLALAFFLLLFVGSAHAQDALTDRLDQVVVQLMDSVDAPGISVAVFRGDEPLLVKGYGWADLENDIPASVNTVYRIGSITKQFTAAAIMQLVEADKVDLSDPVSKHIPDYAGPGRDVTVHQLLNHTSGIPSYTGMGQKFWEKSRLDLSHDELMGLLEGDSLEFEPGSQYRYNNSGYYLLGMIIENVTGASYSDYIDEFFSEGLGLMATTYCDEDKLIRHRARGYEKRDEVYFNAEPLSMKLPFSAGAMCSDVNDLVAWTRALHSGRVVSKESFMLMTTPTDLPDGETQNYGYGLGLSEVAGTSSISHGGGINGFRTYLSRFPEEDVIIVVLTNGNGQPARFNRELAEELFSAEE